MAKINTQIQGKKSSIKIFSKKCARKQTNWNTDLILRVVGTEKTDCRDEIDDHSLCFTIFGRRTVAATIFEQNGDNIEEFK